jgi:hypothetical protein
LYTLTWIVGSALAMSEIALIGLVTGAAQSASVAAGCVRRGIADGWRTWLHLLPEAVAPNGSGIRTPSVLGGFALFFLMEQFLAWHHGHSVDANANSRLPI